MGETKRGRRKKKIRKDAARDLYEDKSPRLLGTEAEREHHIGGKA